MYENQQGDVVVGGRARRHLTDEPADELAQHVRILLQRTVRVGVTNELVHVKMNADPVRPGVSPAIWEQAPMRQALAARDFTAVFMLLRRAGISQRAIAALTGLAASEVYEVTRGRKVMSYDVLVRLSDGLGVPRGYLGLAYDLDTAAFIAVHASGPDASGDSSASGDSGSRASRDEPDDVRSLLEHAAQVTVGVNTAASNQLWTTSADRTTPLPRQAGASDVEQIEHVTAGLRALDYQHGGGACREAVLAHSRWVRQLLHRAVNDDVRLRLHRTLADLHNLAGWTSFDVGLRPDARRHFALALTHSREAHEPSLLANVLYRIGRLHLHQQLTHEALRFFQLGQIAAQEGGGSTTIALLCANEAWAHAMLGNATQALRSLERAEAELVNADAAADGPWVSFFGSTDLTALIGMTHLELAGPQHHLDLAAGALTQTLAERGNSMPRSRAFEGTALAVVQVRSGDVSAGIESGYRAIRLAEQLRSTRVWDRLQPLAETMHGIDRPGAADLRHLIRSSKP